jgi:hypothetical protein
LVAVVIVPQLGHAEDLAGFLLDGVGPVLPDEFEDITDSPDDVVRVFGVIDENAVPVDAERVAMWVLCGRETVRFLEHARRADTQGIERVGRVGAGFPPVAKRTSQRPSTQPTA